MYSSTRSNEEKISHNMVFIALMERLITFFIHIFNFFLLVQFFASFTLKLDRFMTIFDPSPLFRDNIFLF